MTAIYTWDGFTTMDGFGSHNAHVDWGGYWGKQGLQFLDRRAAQYGEELRPVLEPDRRRADLRQAADFDLELIEIRTLDGCPGLGRHCHDSLRDRWRRVRLA
ncbi:MULTISPECIES: hypothetical protein [Arthrobacter]|uniref:Uncharacterized protein n=1 Tax=Arthrobacter terricola TaxID=2547396 RepID=A0A4R5KDH3_9MICC|nr:MULTISPECIES: hypothetical protein [Arthrobacter]MBT8162398.1 hypothetical protein [Arthrobacter sp. GN70]TDF93351.1 hypothetical protein E1809_16005 [Arthrobacter terricola]